MFFQCSCKPHVYDSYTDPPNTTHACVTDNIPVFEQLFSLLPFIASSMAMIQEFPMIFAWDSMRSVCRCCGVIVVFFQFINQWIVSVHAIHVMHRFFRLRFCASIENGFSPFRSNEQMQSIYGYNLHIFFSPILSGIKTPVMTDANRVDTRYSAAAPMRESVTAENLNSLTKTSFFSF